MFLRNLVILTLLSTCAVITVSVSDSSTNPKPNGKKKILKTSKLEEVLPNPSAADAASTEELPESKAQGNKSGIGCNVDGQRYFEGQFMPDVGGPCHACYCLRGRQQCTEIRCRPPVKGCAPVLDKDKCCPVRYDCQTNENAVPISRSNGKLPRSDLLPELGYKFDFDYEPSDIDARVMENHVRIERQSEPDYPDLLAVESDIYQDFVTTELPLAIDVETTVDSVTVGGVPLSVNESESIVNKSTIVPEITEKEDIKKDDNIPVIEETLDYSEPHPVDEDIPTDNAQKDSPIESLHEEISDLENDNLTYPDFVTENPDIDYYYDYEETTKVPALSITEILSKLRTRNEGSVGHIADILPDPITGTRHEEENIPIKPTTNIQKQNNRHEFVSYDIDVGTSLIAGEGDDDIVGVGHVIPIDLHADEDIPVDRPSPPLPLPLPPVLVRATTDATTTTTTSAPALETSTSAGILTSSVPTTTKNTPDKTKPQPSFLNTFLNLFRGGASKTEEIQKHSLPQPIPPPFLDNPPPPFINPPVSREENLNADIFEAPPLGPSSFFLPPPMDDEITAPEDILDPEYVSDTKNELDAELDLDPKPTIESEVKRPKPPNGSTTRFRLPISRRNTTTAAGSKPFYPGLFAHRPKITLSKQDEAQQEQFQGDHSQDEHSLPSDPLVEGGFAAIKPPSTIEENNEDIAIDEEIPTLPPSLPNLKIIPFVAADALVNQGSPPDDGSSGFKPRPFGSDSTAQDCREGGKVWKNGEAVAKGDNDPCVLCRCLLSKVICQHLECATLPIGCTSEEKPAEGECCPKITCDKSANVSIVDTLPSFRPFKVEEEEEVDSPSSPIRPSPFSHQNRRPPFAPASRRPSLSKPSSSVRKPIIPPRLKPTKKSEATEESVKTDDEEPSRSDPVRPIRPIARPTPLKPSRHSVPPNIGSRPRPFSFFNRTGTRPPFVPPRRTSASISTTEVLDSTTLEDSETPDVSSPILVTEKTLLLAPRIPVRQPVFDIIEDDEVRPHTNDQIDFENIFAELLPKDKDSLPQPIHSIQFEDNLDKDFGSDKPFLLPPAILLQKPSLHEESEPLDGEITNFVKQDKFRFTENNETPDVEFGSPIRIQKPVKSLPEIPEVVKAQLPLGNDPILVSGLFELGGCNVYGRMFEVGEEIQEISGQCKACQCTKVGVQCLPIC